MTRGRPTLAALLALVVGGCAAPAAPPPSGPAETSIPPLAGIVLEARMLRHADDHSTLRRAVYARDFPAALVAARAILTEPMLARPSDAAGPTFNDELPERFYDLQDRMIEATEAVEDAALACDREELDDAFARLTGTCRGCHAVYRAYRSRRP